MTTSPLPDVANVNEIEVLARTLGLGWRLDLFGPASQRAERLGQRLYEGDEIARKRFPDGTIRLTLETVKRLSDQFQEKGRAFVEQLFDDGSPEMLVMDWRVIAGVGVGTVHLDLEQAARFNLVVTLRPDRRGTEETYASDNLSDLRLLGQFGRGKLNGYLPVLIGFYPTWRPPV